MTSLNLNTGEIIINGKNLDDIVIEALLQNKEEHRF